MEKVNKLYVGNLNFDTTEDELRGHFEQKGITPKSVTLIKDKYTGKAKGFGFVASGRCGGAHGFNPLLTSLTIKQVNCPRNSRSV